MLIQGIEDAHQAKGNLRKALANLGISVTDAQALNLLAKTAGAKNWHVLAARMKATDIASCFHLLKPVQPHCYISDISGDAASYVAVRMDEAFLREVAGMALSCMKGGVSEIASHVGGSRWLTSLPDGVAEEFDDWLHSGWTSCKIEAYDTAAKAEELQTYVSDEVHVSRRGFWLVGFKKHYDQMETDWLELKDVMPEISITDEDILKGIESQKSVRIGPLNVSVADKGRFRLCDAGKDVALGDIKEIRLAMRMLLFVAAGKN